MKLILRYTFKYKRYLLLSLLGVAGFVFIQIGVPTLFKYVIDDAIMGNNPQLIWRIALIMVIVIILGCAGEICMSFANSKIATNVIRDIRNDMFVKTQSFSHNEFDKFSISSLLTSTTSDAYQVMLFVQSLLRTALVTPVMTISGIVLIVKMNPQMFWIAFGSVPILVGGVIFLSRKSRPYSVKQQKALDNINLRMREGISGLRVIRAFRNEDFQAQRFDKVNQEYTGVSKTIYRIMAIAQPGFYLVFNTMIAFIIWFGSIAIGKGTLDVGALNASIEYVFHILFSFMMFAVLFIMYPRASVSAARINKVLQSNVSIDENLDTGITKAVDGKKGTVEFNNVTFMYTDDCEAAVLENISFTANPGETVAFIGSTGSGKSTLVQLIPRMYEATEGQVLVNGVDVKDYNIRQLRNQVAFIPQKAQLFTGTIEYNLKIGNPDATTEQLWEAAEIAQAADFIRAREGGMDSILAEGGVNLSGGQRQRLAIARGVVKKPDIYIFDDSFSALDYATDLKLRTALSQNVKDATVLIVAQRIGTIRNADKIIVLDEGKIVATGTHEELLDTSGIYYDIAVSQLSEEELS